jgi:hypothetical protein
MIGDDAHGLAAMSGHYRNGGYMEEHDSVMDLVRCTSHRMS